jgi:hypothetical protein
MWDVWWEKWHWGRFENFSFPCQFSFHRLPHTHHVSSGAGTIAQLVAVVPSGLSFDPPKESKKKGSGSLLCVSYRTGLPSGTVLDLYPGGAPLASRQDFPQSLQASAGILPQLRYHLFLPNPYQFNTHIPSYHST